jgi:hypothetical protein
MLHKPAGSLSPYPGQLKSLISGISTGLDMINLRSLRVLPQVDEDPVDFQKRFPYSPSQYGAGAGLNISDAERGDVL